MWSAGEIAKVILAMIRSVSWSSKLLDTTLTNFVPSQGDPLIHLHSKQNCISSQIYIDIQDLVLSVSLCLLKHKRHFEVEDVQCVPYGRKHLIVTKR